MSKILISPWQRKPGLNPRYSIYDGRTPLGTVFESKGVFSAVNPDGRLVAGSTSLTVAVDALCPMAEISS
jgi:hypothetical protein